ncbi:MAG: TonB-dependent receptor plug domain-containing protein [Bacteroidota bacterium]
MDKLQSLILIGLMLFAAQIQAQQRQVSGTVTDAEGIALEGVTVVLLGSTEGTLTDGKGSFRINAAPTDSLRFTYYGLAPQVLLVGEQSTINVAMQASTQSVDEVIIVGYGQQRKESVVAAISTVAGDVVQQAAGGATNLSNALVGQIPGLTTIINSGEPGAEDAQLFIRGQSTWNGGSPLILVDGVERPFNDIDPRDVESISVLKDASATAVFGVKGANGVILITTRRGKIGKPTINVSANATMKQVSRIPETLGSYDALRLRNQAIEHEMVAEPTSWSYYTPVDILNQYRDQTNPDLYPDVTDDSRSGLVPASQCQPLRRD